MYIPIANDSRFMGTSNYAPTENLLNSSDYSTDNRPKRRNLQINLQRLRTTEEKAEPSINGFTPTQDRIIESLYKKNNNNFFCEESLSPCKRNKDPSPNLKRFPITSIISPKPVFTLELVTMNAESSYQPRKIKNLRKLFSLLLTIFKEDYPSDIDVSGLTETDFLILQNLFERKFHRSAVLYKTDRSRQNLLEALTEVYAHNSTKRKEENIKFIFKWIVKIMKREFRLKVEGPMNDFSDFYQDLFNEHAQAVKQSVLSFHDPTNFDRKNHNNDNLPFKSINTDYLKHVFMCPKFKNAFFETLSESDFEKEYTQKLQKKVEKLLVRWDKQVLKIQKEQLEAKIHDYFLKSIRCKLPWTLKEAKNAKICFQAFFTSLNIN